MTKLNVGLLSLLACGALFAQQETPKKPCPADGFQGGFSYGCPQRQFANPVDISAMMAALPDKPIAQPQGLRHVLVLCHAVGWVHTSIPLAAKMVEYLGDKTGAWMTTITYDAAAINTENLKGYDAIFLDSTTGQFLDDPNDKAATDARRQALMSFVKGGERHSRHSCINGFVSHKPPAHNSGWRSGGADGHVARIQRTDWRVFQVPLDLSDADSG